MDDLDNQKQSLKDRAVICESLNNQIINTQCFFVRDFISLVIIGLLGTLLIIQFHFFLIKRTREAKQVFSVIDSGMTREEVIDLLAMVPGVPKELSSQQGIVLRIPWPYVHRTPGFLEICFVEDRVESVALHNPDYILDWEKIGPYLGNLNSSKELLWLDAFIIVCALESFAIAVLWIIKGLCGMRPRRRILVYSLASASFFLLFIIAGISRIAIVKNWILFP